MLPVSFGQWDRLKARVKALGNPRIDFVNYVAGAWGIAIPCALSFFVYWGVGEADRPEWSLPVYGSGAVAAGVVALLLRKFQKQETEIRQEDAESIVGEMNSIEEAYLRGESANR